METEAKFSIPDRHTFEALQQLTALKDFRLASPETKVIVDRYLDTPDHRFMEAGYAFRLRQSKGRSLVTLKSLTPADSHLHRRQELEVMVDDEQPEAWPESEAKALTLELASGQRPETLFVLRQTRHQCQVYLEERPVLELSLDAVSLTAGAEADFFELEAELLEQGTEADLEQFVAILQTNWLLEPQTLSKFERGLAVNRGAGWREDDHST